MQRSLCIAFCLLPPLAFCAARHPWQPPYSIENLLPDSSFEEADQARETYPIIGEYRHRGAGQWSVDTDEHWHDAQRNRVPHSWHDSAATLN